MMKNLIYLIMMGVILALSACEKERIKGSGNTVTQERNVIHFTKVKSSGSTNVHILKDSVFSVKAKGYDNLLPYFETNVYNGELQLGYKNNTNIKNDNVEVFIGMPVLAGVSISGSSSINVEGDFGTTPEFNAVISGSGSISIQEIEPAHFYSNISGSGRIYAFGLLATDASIEISGSGSLELSVITKLDAQISGSGNIYYKGTPAVTADISGSGKIIKQ